MLFIVTLCHFLVIFHVFGHFLCLVHHHMSLFFRLFENQFACFWLFIVSLHWLCLFLVIFNLFVVILCLFLFSCLSGHFAYHCHHYVSLFCIFCVFGISVYWCLLSVSLGSLWSFCDAFSSSCLCFLVPLGSICLFLVIFHLFCVILCHSVCSYLFRIVVVMIIFTLINK